MKVDKIFNLPQKILNAGLLYVAIFVSECYMSHTGNDRENCGLSQDKPCFTLEGLLRNCLQQHYSDHTYLEFITNKHINISQATLVSKVSFAELYMHRSFYG